jgi:hypothetical protein
MKEKKQFMKKKHIEERKRAYSFLLALPPIVALFMIGFVSYTNKAVVIAQQGVMLSPVKDSSPLILSLSIFIIGYMVFIGLLFKENIKNFFIHSFLHKH